MTDYTARQRDRDREYQDAYQEWFSSLSLEEQETMREQGLDSPHLEGKAHGVDRERDFSESAVDRPTQAVLDAPNTRGLLEDLRQVVAVLISGANLQVEVTGLCFAVGLSTCALWGSQSQAARALRCSRQHLGKSVKRWQKLLDLPQNIYTSSKAKGRKLSEVQKAGHWRKRTFGKKSA